MKKIIVAILFGCLFSLNSSFSQDNYITMQYEMSFGTGDLGEFISAPSFRGAAFQYKHTLTGNFLVGFDLAWNVFYEEKSYDTYSVNSISLSGLQYRYQNECPIFVTVDYLFSPENKVQPYIGLGIGTMYSERLLDMGMYRFSETAWHFALKPELGMMYELSPGVLFKLSAKYTAGFAAGDLDENQSYFTLGAGITFRY